jgi:hypothetical protein
LRSAPEPDREHHHDGDEHRDEQDQRNSTPVHYDLLTITV